MFPNSITSLYGSNRGYMNDHEHVGTSAPVWPVDHNIPHAVDTVDMDSIVNKFDGRMRLFPRNTLHRADNAARIGGALLEADYIVIVPRDLLSVDEKEWWDVFRTVRFTLFIGGCIVDQLDFIAYPLVIRMLTSGDRFPTYCVDPEYPRCIIFTLPLLFDCIVRDNVLPLPSNNNIELSVTGLTIYHHRRGLRTRHLAPEHNPIDFPRPGDLRVTDRLIYQLQMDHPHCFKTLPATIVRHFISIDLDFTNCMTGIHFAILDSMGRVVTDSDRLVKDITLVINNDRYSFTPQQCYEQCVQWQSPTDSLQQRLLPLELAVKDTKLDDAEYVTKNTTPFPVEVWANIFQHIQHPSALIRTCKFLRTASYKKNIRRHIDRNGSVPRGWYSLPFASVPLERYIIHRATINMSRLDMKRLQVTFQEGVDVEQFGIYICGISFNVLRHISEMTNVKYVSNKAGMSISIK